MSRTKRDGTFIPSDIALEHNFISKELHPLRLRISFDTQIFGSQLGTMWDAIQSIRRHRLRN